MEVLIFGDQTADQFPLLRKICSRNDNSLLATFLERASSAIREEIKTLPSRQREAFPDFLTVTQLVQLYSEHPTKVAQLESVLVTVAQLGHYIGYFSEHPEQLPSSVNTRSIGLCTGLLAACAVTCCRSLSDLLPLAIEAVRLSFRTGTVVASLKDLLEPSSKTGQTWSTIVTNTSENTAQVELDQFHAGNCIPTAKQAYISAVSVLAVTISGPPSTLEALFQKSAMLKGNHRVPIPVFAPYHAAHLINGSHYDQILTQESKSNMRFFRPIALLHSAQSGKCLEASSATELFQIALREILELPVRWDQLLNESVAQILAGEPQCSMTAVGISNVANSLASALKAAGHVNLSTRDHTTWGSPSATFGRTQYDKIAIVGMSGRFPGAANHDELWDLLQQGLDVHREVPADRFDAQAHYDPTGKGKNKSHTPFGCFIDEPGLFDPRFFNMSPREAAQTDPMGRLALVTAYEALEMSGYVPNRTPSTRVHRIGTFYGQTSDDWREINASENIDTYFITGGVRAFAPGRINYYFKFSGPSYSIDTACSSSLAAIQLACTSLWAGDCDTACAGGLNVLTNPDIFSGLSKGQFLSKTGSCKTYDNDADGYCRGDGCGTVILKRYEDAIADNDNILACILGAATNHSAEAVSITHPHAGAQEYLYKKVLGEAGVDAHEVSYVEMHGTGTQAGDGIEMTSVTNAFAPRNRQRRRDQPLYLGAVKANIGHGEAASGINSLIKIMMMLRKGSIPANVGIKGIINQTFPKDLAQRMVNIPTTQTALPRRGAEPRKVFLNNFSAAGGNTAVLIEDGPLRINAAAKDPRMTHLVAVSARSIASLKRNIDNLVAFLDINKDVTLPSLAYTTTARRIQHNYRVAFTVSDMKDVKECLLAQQQDTYSPTAMVSTKVAFTFTGQGSQYTGLGKKLFEDLPHFKADIMELNNLSRTLGFPSFLPLLDGTDVTTLSPVVVQLGMSCIQVALARLWASWGIKPVAVIGHSLGEYAALHVAGVLSASDMIFLVGRRAELLERECTKYTHGMLAVKASVSAMEDLLGNHMPEVACINGPEETVLCGTTDIVARLSEAVAAKGFKNTKLNVPFAFHSAQVDPILEKFQQAASTIVFSKPQIPVLSPLTGEVIREIGVIDPAYLARHARETVNFWTALSQGEDEKIFDEKTAWVEIGAHPVCSGMVRSSLDTTTVTAPSLRRGEDPWKTLTTSLCTLYLSGVQINFNEFHSAFSPAHQLIELPTYSFDNKRYWLDYHNNWTLTKGEVHASAENKAESVAEAPPKLSTTSCQKIVFEQLQANSGKVIVRSNLGEPKLHKAVTGHVVNGAPLCPSSLYADMAMTVADYMYKQLRPSGEEMAFDVCNMEVHKPLVAIVPVPPEGQWLEIEADADLEIMSIHLKFRTVTPQGKLLHDHGHGLVKLASPQLWLDEWNRTQYMVQTQVDILKQKLHSGAAHKILRGMAYKLFKALVDYSEPYRGMEEVILDGKSTEATAKIRFQNTPEDGNFFCAPYWVDSLAHLSGFIVNATDTVDSNNLIYISHGWESIRFARPITADKIYQSYVRMQPAPKSISVGDVYIFDGDEIIGLVRGLKFQGVTKRVMDIMVPPVKAGSNAKSQAGDPVNISNTKSAAARLIGVTSSVAQPARGVKVSSDKVEKAKKIAKAPISKNSITSRIMNIIAEETEVDMSELVEQAAFENLGVDSLLSLTISAKFREDLQLEISSSLFTDYPTVGEMRKFFAQYDGTAPVDDSDSSDTASEDGGFADEERVSSPASSAPSPASSVCEEDDHLKPTVATKQPTGAGPSLARKIVATEMDVDISEITDKADLADMGMDSLLSLAILGELREKTGIDLPSTFLVTNATIEEIENALGMRSKAAAPEKPRPKTKPATKPAAPQLDRANHQLTTKIQDVSHFPPANSVLLQGNPRIAHKKLFLVPDGSGSATSYVSIPNISSDVAVYGLNCPFMKKPKDFTCGVPGISTLYMNEIRKRQPAGPYIIGGWSAGGVFAYEVSKQLIDQGDKVERLVLIDSPCPIALEPLPARLHVFFDQVGLLGTGKPGGTPAWLLPHFAATIEALSDYVPQPFEAGKAPPTTAIWCTDGVCPNPNDPRPPPAEGEDPAPMKWLLNNRTDFGDNGWGQLLPNSMEYLVMGGNHFTMMKEPHAANLGSLLRDGLRVKV